MVRYPRGKGPGVDISENQQILPWGEGAPTHSLMGRFGNVMLVNGSTKYQLEVSRGELIRFYLTNAANSRTFNVTFGGLPIKIVNLNIRSKGLANMSEKS